MGNLENNTNASVCKTERDTDTEANLWFPKGKERGQI